MSFQRCSSCRLDVSCLVLDSATRPILDHSALSTRTELVSTVSTRLSCPELDRIGRCVDAALISRCDDRRRCILDLIDVDRLHTPGRLREREPIAMMVDHEDALGTEQSRGGGRHHSDRPRTEDRDAASRASRQH